MEKKVKKLILNNCLFKLSNYLDFITNEQIINILKKEIDIIKNEFKILDSEKNKLDNIDINEDYLPIIDYHKLQKSIYCNKWIKLNKEKKYDRIFHYLKKINNVTVYNTIIENYINKKIKPKDIEYNELCGEITTIKNLENFIDFS